jgi:hypothetical protein
MTFFDRLVAGERTTTPDRHDVWPRLPQRFERVAPAAQIVGGVGAGRQPGDPGSPGGMAAPIVGRAMTRAFPVATTGAPPGGPEPAGSVTVEDARIRTEPVTSRPIEGVHPGTEPVTSAPVEGVRAGTRLPASVTIERMRTGADPVGSVTVEDVPTGSGLSASVPVEHLHRPVSMRSVPSQGVPAASVGAVPVPEVVIGPESVRPAEPDSVEPPSRAGSTAARVGGELPLLTPEAPLYLSAPPTAAPPPAITVRIDRVDVVADRPTAAPAPPRPHAEARRVLSLDDYLALQRRQR